MLLSIMYSNRTQTEKTFPHVSNRCDRINGPSKYSTLGIHQFLDHVAEDHIFSVEKIVCFANLLQP